MTSDERAYVTVEWDNGREGVAISVALLRTQLAAQGLHVVTEAERRVLKAMAKARIVFDPHHRRPIFEFSEDELDACEAELTRRDANPDQAERPEPLVDVIRDAVSGELESAGLRRKAKP